jgi:uncharacterized tellurite resistance protein B-like protein
MWKSPGVGCHPVGDDYNGAMYSDLTEEDKLLLVAFVCSFAWADLEIAEEEREFVRALVSRLELDEEGVEKATAWLDHPPNEDEVDPFAIPPEHKRVFLQTVVDMVGADDIIDRMEIETYAIFEELIAEIREDIGEGQSD